jgi:predicted ATP-binding protein involved in virulence
VKIGPQAEAGFEVETVFWTLYCNRYARGGEPMKINTLRVQNFKNFEDKTLEFSDQFNLIIGDNGTGKTALLDALAVALGAFLNSVNEAPSRHINTRDTRLLGILSGQTFTLESQYPTRIEATGIIREETLTWTRKLDIVGEKYLRTTTPRIKSEAQDIQQAVRSGETITLPVIAHYSTGRLWLEKKDSAEQKSDGKRLVIKANPRVVEKVSQPGSRLTGYTDALRIAINNKQLMAWFERMELIALQNRKPMLVLEAVRQAVQLCLEACERVEVDLNRGELTAHINGFSLPFSLLSDGQRSMLAMVADIAYRMAILNPHLLENATRETPGVVLIDEIDLHLHPRWQRHVIDDLRQVFPKVQFFATTHSPFIIQSMQPGELIDLNEVPGASEYQNKSIEDIVENVMDVDLPQMSERKTKMLEAAKKYYELLETAKGAKGKRLENLKQELDKLSAPFSDDMAYHAFLEMERSAALKDNA